LDSGCYVYGWRRRWCSLDNRGGNCVLQLLLSSVHKLSMNHALGTLALTVVPSSHTKVPQALCARTRGCLCAIPASIYQLQLIMPSSAARPGHSSGATLPVLSNPDIMAQVYVELGPFNLARCVLVNRQMHASAAKALYHTMRYSQLCKLRSLLGVSTFEILL
jgi:hypothetical protein